MNTMMNLPVKEIFLNNRLLHALKMDKGYVGLYLPYETDHPFRWIRYEKYLNIVQSMTRKTQLV
jgi:hypothetical protein